MPGSEDLRVVVQEPHLGAAKAPPTTPSRLPPWLQSRRNKALIATGLLCLLIPAVVVPAVVTSQKKSAQSLANSSSSHAVNQDGTTTLNATTFEDTAASNGSIKVPTRTLNKTEPVVRNLTIVPEVPKRFVAIKDGQVRCRLDAAINFICSPCGLTGLWSACWQRSTQQLTVRAANHEAHLQELSVTQRLLTMFPE